jgi:ABC-2 type transport system permease protein
MTSDAGRQPATPFPNAVPLLQRIYGLGSIFAKSIRDSRRATIIVGAVQGLILVGVSQAIVSEFSTPESRRQIGDLIRAVPPILQGLAGPTVNVETLGGYLTYKYGTFFPLIASLWSILALSSTLASESRRGSLEFVAAAPMSRRRIAIQKLSGHVTMMVIAALVILISATVAGTFGTLPGDEISLTSAAGYALWLALLSLAAGSVAWALAPFLGRGAAAGIAGAFMFAGFILNGYRAAIPELAPFANVSWFGWTTNHLPLAGQFDWLSLVPVLILTVVLFVVGIEAFARRDIGVTSNIPLPGLPRALVGVSGPAARASGHSLPTALSWGIGLGLFGLVLAGSGGSFAEQLAEAPDFLNLLKSVFPNSDITAVGGFLQLMFVEFGLILAGLAAATIVASWASDETSGRLEMLLATPLSRTRWVVAGGIGILVSTAIVTIVTMAGVAIGAAITGGELATPIVGVLVISLYMLAIGGLGVAVAGVFSTGAAGPFVAVFTILTWFIGIIAPPLGLPDAIADLALTTHYGQPMLGVWDPVGIVVSIVLAVGGVAVGAWGFNRRDLVH